MNKPNFELDFSKVRETDLSLNFEFNENKRKFHRRYTVRISFDNICNSIEHYNTLLHEWIWHHKSAFNRLWIQPELRPFTRQIHYHGIVDIKDQISFNRFLKLFKHVGQFHLEALKTTTEEYTAYCLKEVAETSACEAIYQNIYGPRRD